ncbi:serine threonine protein [Moniliophthora roreri]|uniref:non-specific serine/threonine protein kinase n=1 Tax=Moniliophthora roreri TaxID=221103 RepID=A0A0W0G570_MONRR|nr:serine threonine protein [Moniliophthora roreri]
MQGFPGYQQNKGTLVPGQTISVNKYTVQVEKYLSQGGFAHVYLVRTAQPVYNTTHHVLKRIAVANEGMLTDVKKEVDIMRLLKGHPNIVHLIDAAWHRMSNGLYEVFILMEFCPGGGIIDMMNRRLRERLTEAEILQIFVDVCEGVAYMHNSRPPLLHRDLKVENILQASPTSFKLCDFGSATTVSTRLPQTTQEFRALEDDLNRHTTLQYRAPEMIDVHLRRPVDEKSDVWALGVLLYKLCYYTTPFEEHGPLAILNVQYRTPPYPVYSSHMKELIGMMLREHGTQRPTVFEILSHVHRLRGTKSQFQYTIPVPKPLSPRYQTQPKPSTLPNPSSSTISYRQAPAIVSSLSPKPATSPSPNPGVQARDKVLEAIAPMRRGRPTKEHSTSRSSSPVKGKNWLEDEEKAWEAMSKKATMQNVVDLDDAFAVAGGSSMKKTGQQGFGDDFGQQLWNAPDPNSQGTGTTREALPSRVPTSSPMKATVTRVTSLSRNRDTTRAIPTAQKERDAFDGLGLGNPEEKPAPTLAEARKLRTGLAAPTSTAQGISGKHSGLTRPSPSPQTGTSSSQGLVPPPLKPTGSGSSWSSQPPSRPPSSSQQNAETASAETRFPSLEELNASFSPPPSNRNRSSVALIRPGPHASSQPQLAQPPRSLYGSDSDKPSLASNTNTSAARPPLAAHGSSYTSYKIEVPPSAGRYDDVSTPSSAIKGDSQPIKSTDHRRSSIIRRHRSSVTMKHGSSEQSSGLPPTSSYLHSPSKEAQRPEKTTLTKVTPQKDWLTGDDDLDAPSTSIRRPSPEPAVAVVRDSPSKRASFIERSNIPIQEALAATHERLPSPPPKPGATSHSSVPDSPSARAHRMFPELDTTMEPAQTPTDNWSPVAAKNPSDRLRAQTLESSSSADEDGPEDADRYVPPPKSTEVRSGRPQRKGRQSSVHDLVDLYGGGVQSKERDKVPETTRSTITQLPSKPVAGDYMDYVTDKRKSRASPAVPMASRRKSVSPQPISSPAPELSSQKSPSATSPTSPASARSSRPQSMFVFPSKMADTPAPLYAGLSPPPEPEPRTRGTRRTSINDMVQRYEAIDAVARSAAISATPSRMTKADSGTSSQNTAPPAKRSIQSNGRVTASLSAPDQTSSALNKIPSSAAQHTSPTSLPKISPSPLPEPEKPKETEVITPRPRRISTRPLEGSGSVSFPIQKSISSPMEETFKSSDARSPSPERPYQGVGRLIDQWQRKTAETESSRNPIIPKRGFVAKRAELVNGPGRGQ